MTDDVFERVKELRAMGAVQVTLSPDGARIVDVRFGPTPLSLIPSFMDGHVPTGGNDDQRPRKRLHPAQQVDLRAWQDKNGAAS